MPANVAARSVRALRRRPSAGVEPLAMDDASTSRTSGTQDELDALAADLAAPPVSALPALDDDSAIDELAFVLATEHLSRLEKISLLEQWRYDMLLRDVAASEGFSEGRDSGAFLQQVSKALLYLADGCCRH